MPGEWNNSKFVEDYAENAANADINWYEYSVNLPSLLSLLPQERIRVLDFGCGPGDITSDLATRYDIEGCDASPEMIKLAQTGNKGVEFFVWDGVSPFPRTAEPYDAVISKLTVHFVEDLGVMAKALKDVIKEDGLVVFSVPHPISTIPKYSGDYWTQGKYSTEIGRYGLFIEMIHRSMQDYIKPFIDSGFVLTGLTEPKITADQAEQHNLTAEYVAIPRRLNLRFQK